MSDNAAGESIYQPRFIQQLFDEMSATYGVVNLVSSFGFCRRWRRQCIEQTEMPAGSVVVDLMAGMGELCPGIAGRVGSLGRIIAVDYSSVMCEQARKYEGGDFPCDVRVLEADALCSGLPDKLADLVVSSFGLKTFSSDQMEMLATEVHRVLKPGGRFSFVEISIPPWAWLRTPYQFYLNRVIPVVGRLFMGNPENYRMLGVYTMAFKNCGVAETIFRNAGLGVEQRSLFFGCATGLVGRKVGP